MKIKVHLLDIQLNSAWPRKNNLLRKIIVSNQTFPRYDYFLGQTLNISNGSTKNTPCFLNKINQEATAFVGQPENVNEYETLFAGRFHYSS